MDRMSLEAIINVLWMLLSKYCKKDCREALYESEIKGKMFFNND